MRQIICNSNGAFVARMPRPVADEDSVLIKVHHSMISVGTELAPYRANLEVRADESGLQRIKGATGKAHLYMMLAAKNPKKAIRRLSDISKNVFENILPGKKSKIADIVTAGGFTWTQLNAKKIMIKGDSVQVLTDRSPAAYQIISNEICVDKGYVPVLNLKGEVLEGSVAIGILNDNKSNWLVSKAYGTGLFDDSLFINDANINSIYLVVSNAGHELESSIRIDFLEVEMRPPYEDGLPQSELADQGWNVGYSAAGEIIETGRNIRDLVKGDLVACAGAGYANHADFIVVPRNLVCRIPDGCNLEEACTTTVGAIALQGIRRANPQLDEIVAVIGLGLLGQLTTQMLKANGCRVIGFDLVSSRLTKALDNGMDYAASQEDQLLSLIRDITNTHGADCVIITAATKSDAVVNLAIKACRRKGKVVVVGDVGLNIERPEFYKKEIDLLISTSYGPGRYDNDYEIRSHDYPYAYVRWTLNRNMEAYMNLIASKKISIPPLIDEYIDVDNAPDAYKNLLESKDPPLGVIINYRGSQIRSFCPPESSTIKIRGHRKANKELINYALVGAGAFGLGMLVPKMEQQKDIFALKAIVSRHGLTASNFARANQVELLSTDLMEILANPEIDLVVISTRHYEHAEQVILALQAGKNVFVEKPLAIEWQQLENIIQAYEAIEEKPFLMVGYNRRFSPALKALKYAISDRRSPMMINYRLNGGYIPVDSWIQQEEGGGRNIGEACHMYDVFSALTESAVSTVSATSVIPKNSSRLRNDNFIATISYEDGSVCNLFYSAMGPKKGISKERIEVFSDDEVYILDDYTSVYVGSNKKVLYQSDTIDKGHFEQLKRYGQAIRDGNETPIPFSEIVQTSALSLQIEDLIHNRN